MGEFIAVHSLHAQLPDRIGIKYMNAQENYYYSPYNLKIQVLFFYKFNNEGDAKSCNNGKNRVSNGSSQS